MTTKQRHYEQFGPTIKDARLRDRLTQTQVCDRLGISVTYLSKVEHGAQPPPSEAVILEMAKMLNLDSDELIRLAGRIPSDLYAYVVATPQAMGHVRHLSHQPTWEPPWCDICREFQIASGGYAGPNPTAKDVP